MRMLPKGAKVYYADGRHAFTLTREVKVEVGMTFPSIEAIELPDGSRPKAGESMPAEMYEAMASMLTAPRYAEFDVR